MTLNSIQIFILPSAAWSQCPETQIYLGMQLPLIAVQVRQITFQNLKCNTFMSCIKGQEQHCVSLFLFLCFFFSAMGKLCGSFQNYFSFIYFMSAVLHMFDIDPRLMTCSLHLELKVEMFKVVLRSCGYMVDIARINRRLVYTDF